MGLYAFVGSDDQQHQVNAADARQHVAYEAFVTRDIHKAEAQRLAVGSMQLKVSEANVDGDAAALFFFQAVGVNPGKSLDQRGLAMIDVACGAYDDGLHSKASITAVRGGSGASQGLLQGDEMPFEE